MQQATYERHWDDADAIDDRQRHPLRSRLQPPRPATPPPLPRAHRPAEPNVVATKAAPKPVSRLRRAGSALAYVILGFVLGAVFWHFVGFWDFVGQVMFGARTSGTQISQPPPIKLKERVSAVSSLTVTIVPEACTTLQLDRDNGTTTAVACEEQSLPLRSLRIAKREDLWVTGAQRIQEATSRGWSAVKVEMPGKPQEQAAAD